MPKKKKRPASGREKGGIWRKRRQAILSKKGVERAHCANRTVRGRRVETVTKKRLVGRVQVGLGASETRKEGEKETAG